MRSYILIVTFLIGTFLPTPCTPTSDYPPKWTVGQTVYTASGPVSGRGATVEKGVSGYLGIPYAQPPVGQLRFAPPKKFNKKIPIDGTKFGPSCPITTVFGGGTEPNTTGKNLTKTGFLALEQLSQLFDTFSEDCLTVNVWTKPQVGERKKAVLLWIYGGGYSIGSSSDPSYDGQFIVEQEDVVVVSFNYRMNIFGYPGNPHTPANLGILDQHLAIEWVRDNIEGFRGDPSRITLFGQSAGSGSIDLYSYAYTSDPIVSGLILQSGTTFLGTFPPEDTALGWYQVTSTLGCGDNTTNPSTQLSCMRTKSTEAISAAIPQSKQAFGSASFWPTIDEKLVFSDYPARAAAGKFIKAPMLIGNTDFEAGYHKTMASLWDFYLPDAAWDVFDLQIFTCPSAIRANASVVAGLPTWRYRYFGEFEELRLTTVPDSGAWHGSELVVLWDTFKTPGGVNPSKEQIAVGRYMRGAWAAFAKDPKRGLKKYGWPLYDPAEKTLVRLAYNNSVGRHLAKPELYDICL